MSRTSVRLIIEASQWMENVQHLGDDLQVLTYRIGIQVPLAPIVVKVEFVGYASRSA